MTPYLQLQLAYVALSGALGLAVWTAWRAALGRERLRARFLASAATYALLAAAGVVAVRVLDHWRGASQFLLVAWVYYFAGFWLPVFATVAQARLRRGDPLVLGASALLVAAASYALLIEPNRLVQDGTRVELAAWPAGAAPLRVVHVSDLQTVGACARERRAAEMVNALDPDLIVWTGDYIAGPFADPEPAIAAARAFLGSLRARYGVVAIPGHSEPERIRRRVVAGFDHVHYLVDEELALELPDGRRLRIFGASAERPRLDRLQPDGDPALVTIAATHVPDLSGELDGKEVELHLAGHTHGGQIAFPVVGPPVTLSRLPNRFARGLHRFGDHWLHVTPGIGMEGHHAPRIRFLCPPEIDLLLIAGGGEPLEPLARPAPREPWWESWRPNRRSPTLAAQPRGDARGGR